MCSDHQPTGGNPDQKSASKLQRRLKLWELKGGLQCSVIGTCFSRDDLLKIASKNSVRIQDGAADYDVHSFFVQQAGKIGNVARALHKQLEHRYAGIVRKVGACTTAPALESLWETEWTAGRIPGAYWAFLSHTHVSTSLNNRIFGEVHMLSHVLGRTTHEAASRASEFIARIEDLEARAARQTERVAAVVMQRDAALAQIAKLEARSAAVHQPEARALPASRLVSGIVLRDPPVTRVQRALVATRERARGAEQEARRLREELSRLKRWSSQLRQPAAPSCPAADACAEAVRSDIARRIVYIGGRSGGVDNLRRIASKAHAELIHHDGGEEQSVARIDGLIEHCDAVFCPMDCISHSACLRAKALCKKFDKPFVPLRSAGAASFERALFTLTTLP